jgi:hypothetical protein
MNIYLYTSSAEPNSFPKELGEAVKIEGTLRDECDILNPVITLVGFNPANTFNYCYIPDFKRYYFITESSVVRTNVMELIMHVDVLQSWSNQILEQTGYISRNEYEYDLMLVDELPVVKPQTLSNYIESVGTNFFSISDFNFIVNSSYINDCPDKWRE